MTHKCMRKVFQSSSGGLGCAVISALSCASHTDDDTGMHLAALDDRPRQPSTTGMIQNLLNSCGLNTLYYQILLLSVCVAPRRDPTRCPGCRCTCRRWYTARPREPRTMPPVPQAHAACDAASDVAIVAAIVIAIVAVI